MFDDQLINHARTRYGNPVGLTFFILNLIRTRCWTTHAKVIKWDRHVVCAPWKINVEPTHWKRKSSSKTSCLGSILIFGSVAATMSPNRRETPCWSHGSSEMSRLITISEWDFQCEDVRRPKECTNFQRQWTRTTNSQRILKRYLENIYSAVNFTTRKRNKKPICFCDLWYLDHEMVV